MGRLGLGRDGTMSCLMSCHFRFKKRRGSLLHAVGSNQYLLQSALMCIFPAEHAWEKESAQREKALGVEQHKGVRYWPAFGVCLGGRDGIGFGARGLGHDERRGTRAGVWVLMREYSLG